MTPRRRLIIAFGEYLDSLESTMRVEATFAEAVARYDALLRRLEDDPTTNQAPEPPDPIKPKPDWDRWHELMDILAHRALTTNEEREYEAFVRIAKQLDAEEGKAADAALDNLVKEHKHRIASIRRLTAAVRAATEPPAMPSNTTLHEWAAKSKNQPPESWWNATDDPFKPLPQPEVIDNLVTAHERVKAALRGLGTAIGDVVRFSPGGAAHPSQPIEVEMRLKQTSYAKWLWECWIAGAWLTTHDEVGNYTFDDKLWAVRAGDAWLAALSKQLGIPLTATWVDGH